MAEEPTAEVRPWLCMPLGVDFHVMPNDERAKHELDRGCWCRPHLEAAGRGLVIAHQSHTVASA